MKYWYSRNTKLCMRATYDAYGSSGNYRGYVYNGEKFKSIAGEEHTYLYPYPSTSSTSAEALFRSAYFVRNFLCVPNPNTPNTVTDFTYICCCDDDYNDSKYAVTNTISGISILWSANYPGSTILTLTNTTSEDKTLNAVLMRRSCTASDSNSNYGTTFVILTGGILFEEDITIPSGGSYAITFTV